MIFRMVHTFPSVPDSYQYDHSKILYRHAGLCPFGVVLVSKALEVFQSNQEPENLIEGEHLLFWHIFSLQERPM